VLKLEPLFVVAAAAGSAGFPPTGATMEKEALRGRLWPPPRLAVDGFVVL